MNIRIEFGSLFIILTYFPPVFIPGPGAEIQTLKNHLRDRTKESSADVLSGYCPIGPRVELARTPELPALQR
jgi:hypothetical protein